MRQKKEEVNLLSIERLKEIGAVVKAWQRTRGLDPAPSKPELLDMLTDLASELDRLRQPAATPHAKGHLRPVLLDQQGQAITPPPISQQLAVERRAQFDADRFEAIQVPVDLDRWRVFCLRWGMAPPPGGWDSFDKITNVVHSIRLGVKRVPYIDKHFSAVYLTSKGIALPQGVKLIAGILSGVELPDETVTGHGDGKGRFA